MPKFENRVKMAAFGSKRGDEELEK